MQHHMCAGRRLSEIWCRAKDEILSRIGKGKEETKNTNEGVLNEKEQRKWQKKKILEFQGFLQMEC